MLVRLRPCRLAAALLLVAIGAASAQDTRVLKQFGAGFGSDALGVVEASEDTEIDGPQAIASDDAGQIYLLDQVNDRVLAFDPAEPQGATRSIALPPQTDPTDMVVSRGQVYVWAGKPIKLDDGRGTTRALGDPVADEAAQSLFGQMGSEALESETAPSMTRSVTTAAAAPRRQIVPSHGKGPVEAEVARDPNGSAAQVKVTSKDDGKVLGTMKVSVRDRLGTVELIDVDRAGRFYVFAETIPTSIATGAVTFLVRFAPTGALDGVYELPMAPSVALSRRFVTVTPDGDVYFLRTRKAVVDVLGVGFRPLKANLPIELRGPNPAPVELAIDRKGGRPVAAVRPLTRDQVLQTAHVFEAIRWRLSPAAYGADPDSECSGVRRVRRPGYLNGHVNQDVQGIPYCWGCQGAAGQFMAAVSRGVLAGNVCTRNDPRHDVAGVDCSSFVSAAWGLSTHFTTLAIPAITVPVENPLDLKPGDALNKPGSHVMLFLGFTPDRKVEVMEASPGACNGRVCRNVYTLAALLARGYIPRRFKALDGEPPVAANTPAGRAAPAGAKRS